MSKIRIKEANYEGEKRKKYVTKMFDSVAKNYDFLNHFLSLGIDIRWRKKATRLLHLQREDNHLDIASGTGDFAFEVKKKYSARVIGSDISNGMLKVALKKASKKNLDVIFCESDAENLPFSKNSFSSVSIGFGIRNFGDKKKALQEIHTVLQPKGKLVILEFSKNRTPIIGKLFYFYFKYILPKIGAFFSSDKEAYTYLPDSVETFPVQEEFIQLMKETRYIKTYYKNLLFGICTLFYGEKK